MLAVRRAPDSKTHGGEGHTHGYPQKHFNQTCSITVTTLGITFSTLGITPEADPSMDRLTRDGALVSTVQLLGLRGPIAPGSSLRPRRRPTRPKHPRDASLEDERAAASATQERLEYALDASISDFAAYVAAVEDLAPQVASQMDFYTVVFGPGAFGMVLNVDADGTVRVSELRFDASTGEPLLARASGKIAVGDAVVSIGGFAVQRAWPPTLAQLASALQTAPRPVEVLFRRGPAGAGDYEQIALPDAGPGNESDAQEQQY